MVKPGRGNEHHIVLNAPSNARPVMGPQRSNINERCGGLKNGMIQYPSIVNADVLLWNSDIHHPLLDGLFQFPRGGQVEPAIALDAHDFIRFDQPLLGLNGVLLAQ